MASKNKIGLPLVSKVKSCGFIIGSSSIAIVYLMQVRYVVNIIRRRFEFQMIIIRESNRNTRARINSTVRIAYTLVYRPSRSGRLQPEVVYA